MTYDTRIKCPSTTTVSGPSNSGKTSLVFNILQNGDKILSDPRCLQNIIYYYKQWQKSYDEALKHVKITFVNQVPNTADMIDRTEEFAHSGGSVLVIDDFMQELTKDVSLLFSTLAHHLNITVFLLTQNLFSKNPVFRDISLNSTYNIIFKNPRDSSQISHFARQYAPGKASFVVEVYRQATKKPHSYLLFDNHQETDDDIRIRSNILEENGEPTISWVERI